MKFWKKRWETASEGYHSYFYHRFFEGWTEYREKSLGKRAKIRRVYTGEYHVLETPKKIAVRIVLSAMLLTICALLLWGAAVTRQSIANTLWYVGYLETTFLLFSVLLLGSMFHLMALKERLTVYEYESSYERTKILSRAAGIVSFITAAGAFAGILMNKGQSERVNDVICIVGLAGAGLLLNLVPAGLSGIKYRIEKAAG